MARAVVDGGEEFTLTDEQINAAIKDLKNQIVTAGADPARIDTTTLAGILNASAIVSNPPASTSAAQFRAAEAVLAGKATPTELAVIATLPPVVVNPTSPAQARAADVVASAPITGVTPTSTENAIAATVAEQGTAGAQWKPEVVAPTAAQFRAAEAVAGLPVFDETGKVIGSKSNATQTEKDIAATLVPVTTPSAADVRAADVVASSSVTGVTPTPTEIAIAKELGPDKVVTPEGVVDKELPYGIGGNFGGGSGGIPGGGSSGGSGGGSGTPAPVVTPPTPPTPPVTPKTLTDAQRSAFALFKTTLESWGLGEIVPWAMGLYTGENPPSSFNEFYMLLRDPSTEGGKVYYKRFGQTNEERIKAGLPALSEAEIMTLESSYKKTMKAYNLPEGFYDNPSDFQKFIVNDLSAAEVADRVQAANAYVKMQDPSLRAQLNTYYGVDDAALTAAALDPTKGQTILESLASKNTLGIAAATAGLSGQYSTQAAGLGGGELSFAKQADAFARAAESGARGAQLSEIYGSQNAPTFGTTQAVTEQFGGAGAFQEAQKRKRLGQMETNLFSGSSGIDKTSLTRGDTAGAI